jgi:hypothetical protein
MRLRLGPWASPILGCLLLCGSLSLGCGSEQPSDPLQAAVVFAADDPSVLRINPNLNPMLEVLLQSSEGVVEVWVTAAGRDLPAQDKGNGRFLVTLDATSFEDGDHDLVAAGHGPNRKVAPATLTLRVSRSGSQFTEYDTTGTAQTPDLHQIDGRLAMTWTDRRNDQRRVYLQYLDSALQPLGEPLGLTDPALPVARAEVIYDGVGLFGLLFQTVEGEGERRNRIMVVDLVGNEVLAPISIEEIGENGHFGGSISYDGEAFVAIARSRSETADHLRYVRFSGADVLAGPAIVVAAGDGNPTGGFLPFFPFGVAAVGEYALVTFTRQHFSQVLDMQIQRNQVAVVSRHAEVLSTEILPTDINMSFDQEVRVHPIHREVSLLWTSIDLQVDEANPPHRLFGNTANFEVPASRWRPLLMLDEPLDRVEMTLTEDPNGFAHMIWQDLRFRDDPEDPGLIRLMIAPLSEDFRLGNARVLKHPRVFLGGSTPSMIVHKGRLVAAWVDMRNNAEGIYKNEIFLESFEP